MDKRVFVFVDERVRDNCVAFCRDEAPLGSCVTWKADPTRTLDQNALMWPYLECFSRQKAWQVNGSTVRMSENDWKDVLTASFEGEAQRIAMGLHGGFVILGARTSEYGKRKFSEFIEFMQAEAVDMGVDLDIRYRKGVPYKNGKPCAATLAAE